MLSQDVLANIDSKHGGKVQWEVKPLLRENVVACGGYVSRAQEWFAKVP